MLYPSEQDPIRAVRLTGCLVLSLAFFVACLLPFLLVDLAQQALTNLHLSPSAALLVLLGIIFGSAINIPIVRRPTKTEVTVPVFEPIGGWFVMPRVQRLRQELVIAVNVGGCVIPVLLAIWLSRFIVAGGTSVVSTTLIGMTANTLLCYLLARPIPNLGIALPFFVPALTALFVTWLGLGDASLETFHAPVAFVIGITGPLVGADLLHWRDFDTISAGTMSIGGAGTWDGIVLSGLLAALWA